MARPCMNYNHKFISFTATYPIVIPQQCPIEYLQGLNYWNLGVLE